MTDLTVEGHFVFTTLDELGRRRINSILENGELVVSAGATLISVLDSLSLSDLAFANRTFAVSDSLGLNEAILTNKSLVVTDVSSLLDLALLDKSFTIQDKIVALDHALTDKSLRVTDKVQLDDLIAVLGVFASVILSILEVLTRGVKLETEVVCMKIERKEVKIRMELKE